MSQQDIQDDYTPPEPIRLILPAMKLPCYLSLLRGNIHDKCSFGFMGINLSMAAEALATASVSPTARRRRMITP